MDDDQGCLTLGSKELPILWPWDFFAWLWNTERFSGWVSQRDASTACRDFWGECEHLSFYSKLGLRRSDHSKVVPLVWHTDGVKMYRNSKEWVYSCASACRKGTSLRTKFVVLVLRETLVIKFKTHDAIGRLIGCIMDCLLTGLYPEKDWNGSDFHPGSVQAQRAGTPFAGGWRVAFAGFKSDLEARVLIHKFVQNWTSTAMCERCPASRLCGEYSFGDFRLDAAYLRDAYSHEDYLRTCPASRLSAWTHVRGWEIHRNLEDPRLI